MSEITFYRKKSFVNKLRTIDIFIDDVLVGKINNGEKMKLNVEDGQHKMYVKVDWLKSEILTVEINENNQTFIEISSKEDKYLHLKGLLWVVLIVSSYFMSYFNFYFKLAYYVLSLIIFIDFIRIILGLTIYSKKYLNLAVKI